MLGKVESTYCQQRLCAFTVAHLVTRPSAGLGLTGAHIAAPAMLCEECVCIQSCHATAVWQ